MTPRYRSRLAIVMAAALLLAAVGYVAHSLSDGCDADPPASTQYSEYQHVGCDGYYNEANGTFSAMLASIHVSLPAGATAIRFQTVTDSFNSPGEVYLHFEMPSSEVWSFVAAEQGTPAQADGAASPGTGDSYGARFDADWAREAGVNYTGYDYLSGDGEFVIGVSGNTATVLLHAYQN